VKTEVKKVLSRAGWRRVAAITFVEEGPGRSPDQLRQMFEPHYSNREEDRGLGLALAHILIQQHEGRMYALSDAGQGVRVMIELPLSDPTVT
jgi:two-component system NtrC family sensor kinase